MKPLPVPCKFRLQHINPSESTSLHNSGDGVDLMLYEEFGGNLQNHLLVNSRSQETRHEAQGTKPRPSPRNPCCQGPSSRQTKATNQNIAGRCCLFQYTGSPSKSFSENLRQKCIRLHVYAVGLAQHGSRRPTAVDLSVQPG